MLYITLHLMIYGIHSSGFFPGYPLTYLPGYDQHVYSFDISY